MEWTNLITSNNPEALAAKEYLKTLMPVNSSPTLNSINKSHNFKDKNEDLKYLMEIFRPLNVLE